MIYDDPKELVNSTIKYNDYMRYLRGSSYQKAALARIIRQDFASLELTSYDKNDPNERNAYMIKLSCEYAKKLFILRPEWKDDIKAAAMVHNSVIGDHVIEMIDKLLVLL